MNHFSVHGSDVIAFKKFAAHAAANITEIKPPPPDHVDLGAGIFLPASKLPADLQSRHNRWSRHLRNAEKSSDREAAAHAREQLADVAHETRRRIKNIYSEKVVERRFGKRV